MIEAALDSGMPASLVPVGESSILNASPYLCDFCWLRSQLGDGDRKPLFRALEGILDVSRSLRIMPRHLMVGGSILQRNESPRDLDCVLFYEVDGCEGIGETIKGLQAKAKAVHVDARWIPIDGDPMVAIRSAVFFATLYSFNRASPRSEPRGVALISLD